MEPPKFFMVIFRKISRWEKCSITYKFEDEKGDAIMVLNGHFFRGLFCCCWRADVIGCTPVFGYKLTISVREATSSSRLIHPSLQASQSKFNPQYRYPYYTSLSPLLQACDRFIAYVICSSSHEAVQPFDRLPSTLFLWGTQSLWSETCVSRRPRYIWSTYINGRLLWEALPAGKNLEGRYNHAVYGRLRSNESQ